MSNTPRLIGKIDAIEQFCHLRLIASGATTLAHDFFEGVATSSTEPNRLGTDGFLPENKAGYLIGVTAQFFEVDVSTGANARLDIAFMKAALLASRVSITVGGIRFMEAPLLHFPTNGIVIQGAADPIATAALQTGLNMGGAPLPFVEHPIYSRQAIRVHVESTRALPARAATATLGLQIGLICKTSKALAS